MDYIYLGLSTISFVGLWNIYAINRRPNTSEIIEFWILLILFVFFGNQYIHTLIK